MGGSLWQKCFRYLDLPADAFKKGDSVSVIPLAGLLLFQQRLVFCGVTQQGRSEAVQPLDERDFRAELVQIVRFPERSFAANVRLCWSFARRAGTWARPEAICRWVR